MNGEYLAKMEDVLQVYEQQPAALSSVKVARMCSSERPCQLLDEVVVALPMQKNKPKREHSGYERKGTACILLAYDLDTAQHLRHTH